MQHTKQIERVLRRAKHPCQAKVDGHKCFDIWMAVKVHARSGRRVAGVPVKCYTHGHRQDGQMRLL